MSAVNSVKVIINTHSGLSDKNEARRLLTEIFEAGGLDFEVSLARSGTEVARLAKQAVREKWMVIVAGGGDGTVNIVASQVIGTDKILGVVPLGTFNHF